MHVVAGPPSTALRLAERLWRARGPHVERLVDVRDGREGEVELVVDRGQCSLREILAGGLALGQATTVLVPLAECIDRLARLGIAHGAIAADTIRLNLDGAPVLVGFDLAPPRDRLGEQVPSADDFDGYRRLVGEVLAAVVDEPDTVARLLGALGRLVPDSPGALLAFAERLLESAAPRPVSLTHAPTPSRTPALEGSAGPRPRSPRPQGRVRAAWRSVIAVRGRLGPVRARFWVIAGVGGAGVAITLVLLMSAPAAPARTAMPETTASAAPTERGEGPPPSHSVAPSLDPVDVVLGLRHDARAARIVEDFGDLVLLELDTAAGPESAVVERTDAGWRLRATRVDAESD